MIHEYQHEKKQHMYNERIKRNQIIFIFQKQLETDVCSTEQYKVNRVFSVERDFKEQHGKYCSKEKAAYYE